MSVNRLLSHVLAADVDSDDFYSSVDDFDGDDMPSLLALADHQDPEVRRAFVSTLPLVAPHPDENLLTVVIGLTVDPSSTVRDHACFVLAEQWRDIDTSALRNALANRLDDLHRDTRCEALVGLAYRGDSRAAPRVYSALTRKSGDLYRLELIAAGALSDPLLHPLVLRQIDDWNEADSDTIEAVRRLTDPDGVGPDLFRGVAELYRVRAHPASGQENLEAWQVMEAMLDIAPRRTREFFVAVAARLIGDQAALTELETRSALGSEFWT